jgi:hypothetical protein
MRAAGSVGGNKLRTFLLSAATSLALAAGCGPSATPAPVVARKTEARVVKPPPCEAIIYGTDARGGSQKLDLDCDGTQVQIDAMVVRGGSPTVGGVSSAKLSTAPNKDGSVRVGVYESVSAGLGPNWRAGVWLSAFVAATTLNKDLTDFTFTAEAAGMVDGASASGLMTAAYLASMLGRPLVGDASMTGIINPDGTIGPVGGIPHKFEASIAAGKRRVGYPVGMRYAQDMNTGQAVDLVKLAKDKGAEAVEIADLYDAYRLMTGETLPRPAAVDAREMALENEVIEAFEGKYREWVERLGDAWKQLVALYQEGRLPKQLVPVAEFAMEQAAAAEKQLTQGLPASAHPRMVTAWTYAASAVFTQEVIELLAAGDFVGARARIELYGSQTGNIEGALRAIGEMRPDTMGGHLQMMSAFQKAIAGLSADMAAAEGIQRATQVVDLLASGQIPDPTSAEVLGEAVQYVWPFMLAVAQSVSNTAVALETQEIEAVKSISYMCSLPNVKRLSTSFESAANANVTYYESFLEITKESERFALMAQEPDYMTAFFASKLTIGLPVAQKLKEEWSENSLPWGILRLSSAQLAYNRASALISKRYSLGVQTDWTGKLVAVANDRAFMNMLTSAEQKARENAQAAKVTAGDIPVQARIAYQQALLLREGSLADKLAALELFWASSTYSQTAVMLARN